MIRFPSSSASCPGTGAKDGICWEECRYIPLISKRFFTVINSVQIPAHLPTYLHEADTGQLFDSLVFHEVLLIIVRSFLLFIQSSRAPEKHEGIIWLQQ